jgi:hypothetical protein
VYASLIKTVKPLLYNNEYYNDNLLIVSLNTYLINLSESNNIKNIDKNETNNLIDFIENTFYLYKSTHYIIIPLQESILSHSIKFDNYVFIKANKKYENITINTISRYLNVPKSLISDTLIHLKRSRNNTDEFLKTNLLIIKTDILGDYYDFYAHKFAQNAINILKLLTFCLKTNKVKKINNNYVNYNLIKKIRHIGILDDNKNKYSPLYDPKANYICNIDLDFIKKKKNQDCFRKFEKIFNSKKRNPLVFKFYNALFIYSKANEILDENKDYILATILYFIALESLITEDKNGKRLRLSVVLPIFLKYPVIKREEISEKINNLYKLRNDFVHAGKESYSIIEDIKLLKECTAKTIFKFLEFEESQTCIENTNSLGEWKNNIDKIYNKNKGKNNIYLSEKKDKIINGK